MNYYRRYSGDFQADTRNLSLAEVGAYDRLLDHYYSTEQPLEDDIEESFRICGAVTQPEQKAVRKIVDRFFPPFADGKRHNKRADEELAISKQARENGGKGGRPSKTRSQTGNKTGVGTERRTGYETGRQTGEGGGLGQPPATSHQPPTTTLHLPAAATATREVEDSDLSTGSKPDAVAAAGWIYPEQLTHADRSTIAERLNGHPRGQLYLDELAGVIQTKGARNPVGLLVSFIDRDSKGQFTPSHAARVQVEREAYQAQRELEAQGRTATGERTAA